MKYFLTSFFILCALATTAQKITVSLPHFADKEYVWIMLEGEKRDTVARGALDANGQAILIVPPAYKNWQGMSNCLLTEGGGLEIILNGEKDFTAACTVEKPTVNDIYYTGSPENSFLLEKYKQQQKLLNKAGAITAAVQEYEPKEPLYKTLSKEKQSLEERFAELQEQIAKSPLYAARVRQISDFCTGIGSHLNMKENEFNEEQRRYVREVVDFGQLWKSGMWKTLFSQWMSLEKAQGDSILLEDSKAILNRVQDKDMHEIVLKKITSLFQQYKKEDLITQLDAKN